ncbi:MAG: LamB/YcsF family, partial [Mycobacterium sp.]|nr:LamB/YcsF family [Mycobacterium sp.]
QQAIEIVLRSQVISIDGVPVPLAVRTLCLHGDSPHALDLLRELRSRMCRGDTVINVEPFRISGHAS